MVVDGLGPEPIEVQTPRPGSILSNEEHEVTIVLSEEGGIDFESLRLAWWVENLKRASLSEKAIAHFCFKEMISVDSV